MRRFVFSPLPRSLASLSESGFGGEGLGVRGTSRAAPPVRCLDLDTVRESERRTQTVIPLHPSPLTPGPSPTTASLADARGAAGERGENIALYRSEPLHRIRRSQQISNLAARRRSVGCGVRASRSPASTARRPTARRSAAASPRCSACGRSTRRPVPELRWPRAPSAA